MILQLALFGLSLAEVLYEKGFRVMEELAKELLQQINNICVGYHYFRQTDTVDKGKELIERIQQFTSVLLESNVCDTKEERLDFQNYVVQVLKDYTEAIVQRDAVQMVDTLDYGLRGLLDIFAKADDGEEKDE